MEKQAGYQHGIAPGLALFEQCAALGIEEISVYGVTQHNTRRPAVQKEKFSKACVDLADFYSFSRCTPIFSSWKSTGRITRRLT